MYFPLKGKAKKKLLIPALGASALLFFSTNAMAGNPFLGTGSNDGASAREIQELKREIETLKSDINTLLMQNSGSEGAPKTPDIQLEKAEELDTDKFSAGFFEINGMYILKSNSDTSIKYMDVSREVFEESVSKGIYRNSDNAADEEQEKNEKQ